LMYHSLSLVCVTIRRNIKKAGRKGGVNNE
jgi:hypothetical protein